MEELFSFLRAVLSHWILLMTGVVALVLTFWERISGSQPANRLFWGIAIFCFVGAFFLAWRDEHRALVTERRENTPQLLGRIEQIATGDAPDLGAAQAFILMTVKNVGAPSVAEGFKLNITSQELNLSVDPIFIPEGYTLFGEDQKPIAVFHRDDAIYEKSIKPIDRGGLVRGWLRYDFKGMKAEQIRKAGTRWTIRFYDVVDLPYTAVYEMTGGPSELKYYPGAEQPFRLPKDNKSEPNG